MHPVVCIDGPAAAGKSTVARAVASRLGYLYVDSGSLYRMATWKALREGLDPNDPDAMTRLAAQLRMTFEISDGAVVARIDGDLPGDAIRTDEVNRHVSPVSAVPAIRERVTSWLRELRTLGPLIVEGRDIGSVVFPGSPARFYLDADAAERARRRHQEELERGLRDRHSSLNDVRDSLLRRDQIDSTRKAAPLTVARGARIIDTTALSVAEVVDAILAALPDDDATEG